MATYGELFLRDYGIVTEEAAGKGLQVLFSNDCADGNMHLNLGNKLKKAKKYKEAIGEYNEAKKYYRKAEQDAHKIEDDSVATWAVRILLTPPIVALLAVAYSDLDLKTITRSSTVNIIKDIIRNIDKLIYECRYAV